jgi:hypothetical protein
VFERTLQQMCERLRARRYVMTLHAEEEMNDDDLSLFDVENSILTGYIVERQKDHDTGEWKYLIHGRTLTEEEIVVVATLSLTGTLVIIIVYRC